MRNKKKNLGITLIGLVVTIIVIFVLAGIVLLLMLGDNGILNQSKDAIEKYRISYDDEQEQMNNYRDANVNGNDALSGTISNMTGGEFEVFAKVELAGNIDYTNTRYVFSSSNAPIGTTDLSKFCDGKISNSVSVVKKAKPEGAYYLHVLLVGLSGSKTELISSESATSQGFKDFDYVGDVQEYELSPGEYQLEVWGAQGGNATKDSSSVGGKGGYSVGTLTLNESTIMYINVGGQGSESINTNLSTGGYNGGGGNYSAGGGATGGGATDVRINTNSLYSRVIVAGGGSGGAWGNINGSNGGGLLGVDRN